MTFSRLPAGRQGVPPRLRLRGKFVGGAALNIICAASAMAQTTLLTASQPTAADSGALTVLQTVVVTGHYRKTDASGYSNSTKIVARPTS